MGVIKTLLPSQQPAPISPVSKNKAKKWQWPYVPTRISFVQPMMTLLTYLKTLASALMSAWVANSSTEPIMLIQGTNAATKQTVWLTQSATWRRICVNLSLINASIPLQHAQRAITAATRNASPLLRLANPAIFKTNADLLPFVPSFPPSPRSYATLGFQSPMESKSLISGILVPLSASQPRPTLTIRTQYGACLLVCPFKAIKREGICLKCALIRSIETPRILMKWRG